MEHDIIKGGHAETAIMQISVLWLDFNETEKESIFTRIFSIFEGKPGFQSL